MTRAELEGEKMTTEHMLEFLEDVETQNELHALYNNPHQIMNAIAAKLRAAEALATEVSKLADYWGKTCDVMLALENYRKVGEDK